MYQKEFDAWNLVKKRIHGEEKSVFIRAGEIRWATIGVNIGSEMDGKGESFTRPVLIVHVVGKNLALVIPLSTKLKEAVGYSLFEWKDKTNALCIHQAKIISQKRILNRLGKISDNKLAKVKNKLSEFYQL